MDKSFKEFILEQEDSKPIDINQDFWCKSWNDSSFIGDPVIQFGREVYPEASEIEATWTEINIWNPGKNCDEKTVYYTLAEEFLRFCEDKKVQTFGEAKKYFEQ